MALLEEADGERPVFGDDVEGWTVAARSRRTTNRREGGRARAGAEVSRRGGKRPRRGTPAGEGIAGLVAAVREEGWYAEVLAEASRARGGTGAPALALVGVGNVADVAAEAPARAQLALALALRDDLGVAVPLPVYEPRMDDADEALLRALGCEARRAWFPTDDTWQASLGGRGAVLYLPHVEHVVVNAIVTAWQSRTDQRLVLIANAAGAQGPGLADLSHGAGAAEAARALAAMPVVATLRDGLDGIVGAYNDTVVRVL